MEELDLANGDELGTSGKWRNTMAEPVEAEFELSSTRCTHAREFRLASPGLT